MNRRLFAHLCTWFSTPEVSGRWEMWNSEYDGARHDPSVLRADGRRDIAAFGYPLIGPYDSADEDAIRWQLSLMQACGIDGVIVDWDGRRINPHRHEKFLALLRVLREYPLKLIVCFEEWAGYYPLGTFASAEEGVSAAIGELAWLRENVIETGLYEEQNGRFPVFVFRKMPGHMFGRAEWEGIKASSAARGMEFYFEDCYDPQIEEAADGWFFWVGGFDAENRNSLAYHRDAIARYEARVRALGGKKVVPSLVPGFDDTCVWGWGDGKRVAPRENGARYELCCEHVLAGEFDLAQIVTWNDWNEGSHIEPSADFGYAYLCRTARFAAQWKGTACTAAEADFAAITDVYLQKKRKTREEKK